MNEYEVIYARNLVSPLTLASHRALPDHYFVDLVSCLSAVFGISGIHMQRFIRTDGSDPSHLGQVKYAGPQFVSHGSYSLNNREKFECRSWLACT